MNCFYNIFIKKMIYITTCIPSSQYISITQSNTQQTKVSHLHMPITHTYTVSWQQANHSKLMFSKYQSLILMHKKKLKLHMCITHTLSAQRCAILAESCCWKMCHLIYSRLVTQMLGKYQSLTMMLNKLKRHMSINHTLLYSNICILNSRLVT